ncbi:phosphoribosylanthranilate isomerase [Mycoplana sp. MJR14]|uniref:phosphoribosylanthranilate isomerase n=1 Tax=Mycoplana sp. MJR14 TaxID=3032583 RepID=UPI0023DBDE4C|nr:phosphoribosylanthranilate isomerase [Mycoplana sp. MJR14]MDF1633042.1 phosphoribosylanthranilate isomerase [Mycoplana sp. MJR14]
MKSNGDKNIDIKICGLKTPEAVLRAVDLGATHVGFIFFGKSPRNIEPSDAGALADLVRGRAKIVAVTVDADNDELDEIVSLLRPDVLQLHGNESPERVLTVKAVYGLPVMKALSVREAADLEKVDAYVGIADRFLFDAKPPAGSQLPGGNGVSFDWTLMDALDGGVDYMLSGGLNKDNVEEAVAATRAPGVDVSSGVESAPGVKDIGRMEEFFEALRRATGPAVAAGSRM